MYTVGCRLGSCRRSGGVPQTEAVTHHAKLLRTAANEVRGHLFDLSTQQCCLFTVCLLCCRPFYILEMWLFVRQVLHIHKIYLVYMYISVQILYIHVYKAIHCNEYICLSSLCWHLPSSTKGRWRFSSHSEHGHSLCHLQAASCTRGDASSGAHHSQIKSRWRRLFCDTVQDGGSCGSSRFSGQGSVWIFVRLDSWSSEHIVGFQFGTYTSTQGMGMSEYEMWELSLLIWNMGLRCGNETYSLYIMGPAPPFQ